MDYSVLKLIAQSSLIIKISLLLLIFFSVATWAIIFFKFRQFSVASKESSSFLKAFRAGQDAKALLGIAKLHRQSPVSALFMAAVTGHPKDRVVLKRLVARQEAEETERLERYLGFLATTSSASPFIGLFGTVWGVMDSFRSIGSAGAASLAVVAPGVAEALIATALGLVAAIPALLAYNFFAAWLRKLIAQMENFSDEFVETVTGHHDEKQKP